MITQKELQDLRSLYSKRLGESHGSNTVIALLDEIDRLRGELQLAATHVPIDDSQAYKRAVDALHG